MRNNQEPRNQPGGGEDPLSGAPTGLALAGRLVGCAGPERRYAGLGDAAVITAAGRWDAERSWAAGQLLAAIREIIRRRPLAGNRGRGGKLPAVWRKDLAEEIALELSVTGTAAGTLIGLAWTLEARLPLTGAALEAGILNEVKARIIADETAVLSDEDAGRAEELMAGWWKGKTTTQIRAKVTRIVVNLDPEGARKRRERAEREDARVRLWREEAGTAGLGGFSLPPDRALRAMARIQALARAYRTAGVEGTMDQLRVLAYLDMLTGTDTRTQQRVSDQDQAPDSAPQDSAPQDSAPQDSGASSTAPAGDGTPADGTPDSTEDSGNDGNGDTGSDEDGTRDDDGGNPGAPDPAGPGGGVAAADEGLAANLDLTITLPSLTEHAQRAGQARNWGALDPDLARRLAAEAARNPHTIVRVIITDPDGRAIGFGQAAKRHRPRAKDPPHLNLDQSGAPLASFVPAGPGPPGGYGRWALRIGDLELTVKLHGIPDGPCEHRYESAGYQPSDTLRRLVQIRDGECHLPVCTRNPARCEFEHAIPWPQGRTCTCNGGTHCRHDHHLKQTPGWKVEQHDDGRRTWTTPAGLTYTSDHHHYPT